MGELILQAAGGAAKVIMGLVQRRTGLIFFCIFTVISMTGINLLGKEGKLPVHVENVFDEMLERSGGAMEHAERVMAGGHEVYRLSYPIAEDPDMEIGLIYSREYKKLYIYGEAEQEGEGKPYQEYFEQCLKEKEISLSELEDYKEQFICRDLLGDWFDGHNSRFSRDNLGNLEVTDYLMPYEYAGTDNESKKEKVTVETEGYDGLFGGKVTYTVWSQALEGAECIQQSREYGYRDVLSRVADDMSGISSNGERFYIIFDGEDHEFYIGTFISWSGLSNWMKENTDRVYGNLAGPAYNREEGEERTRRMLRNIPDSRILTTLSRCEFYMDDEYLYLRFPYYMDSDRNDYIIDDEGEKVENGKGHNRTGWLAVRWDDIRETILDYNEE